MRRSSTLLDFCGKRAIFVWGRFGSFRGCRFTRVRLNSGPLGGLFG